METQTTLLNILKHTTYCPVQVSDTCHNIHKCHISHKCYIFKFSYGFARPTIIVSITIQGYYKRNRHFQRYVVIKTVSVVDTQFA